MSGMKTTIGGDRLGSGNKQEISKKNFERSTHDLSANWRSSMSSGTLVPFMVQVGLPGDVFDIDLSCEVVTLPTIGPLFGSYKVQLDVFEVPIRLYNAGLMMNKLNIGNDMSKVLLPQVVLQTNNHPDFVHDYTKPNEQINNSCIFKYLGISGLGAIDGTKNPASRFFNALPYLGYWDIFKQYYSNKQEDKAYVVHTEFGDGNTILRAELFKDGLFLGDILTPNTVTTNNSSTIELFIYTSGEQTPNVDLMFLEVGAGSEALTSAFDSVVWNPNLKRIACTSYNVGGGASTLFEILSDQIPSLNFDTTIALESFPLVNIDTVREKIMQQSFSSAYTLTFQSLTPYRLPMQIIGSGADASYAMQYSQEGLAVKTYQSDLFNNWINTEWIDGTGGINEITSIDTSSDSFTLDTLNLAQKVYNMLNRIAVSGGTYDDWLDAVYAHDRHKGMTSPVYHGGLIKELQFEEVISQAETNVNGNTLPLGTLAGRGRLTGKNKGGRVSIKVNEPSYIMGIVSLTPRINYSQGNVWDVNLKTLNDLHKPHLDAIGYQDLVTEQMVWSDSEYDSDTNIVTHKSAGKQPAWINYMTDVDRVYGNFAEELKDMFMILNRRYDVNATTGKIKDLTTYIDPTKYNNIFAQTDLSAQNFWVQIRKGIKARRKMSAKLIPNL
jgi:hypothetical protein